MLYRKLGRTDMQASIVGMGIEGLLGKTQAQVTAFFDVMEAAGVNILDMYASDPEMRKHVGIALQGRREKFILQAHLCSIWVDGQYKRTRDLQETKDGFADLLTRLQTDHVEIGMIHYCDAMDDWQTIVGSGILAYAEELKACGKIKAIGMSSHNPQVALAAVRTGKLDVLMFSVNPCYDLQPADEDVEQLWNPDKYTGALVNMDPERQQLYEECQQRGVAITVMKPFGGGDLLDAKLSPAGVALTPYQCMQYALDRPGVASLMCGARTVEELQDCIGYLDAPQAEKDYAEVFASMPKISWKGHCMYCGHCAPCPVGISVADVTKFYHLAVAQGAVPETVREHYAVLPHHAGECIQCGMCLTRCPFEVDSMGNMAKAAEAFGY